MNIVHNSPKRALVFLNALVAEGTRCSSFTRLSAGRADRESATANMLSPPDEGGLLDRVSHDTTPSPTRCSGHDRARKHRAAVWRSIRRATPSHRISVSGFDEHDLISHPSRTISSATTPRNRIRFAKLSDRPLRIVPSQRSCPARASAAIIVDLGHRSSLLDAAANGQSWSATVLRSPKRIVAAGSRAHPNSYRAMPKASDGPRPPQLGSLPTHSMSPGLAGRLRPIRPPKGDIIPNREFRANRLARCEVARLLAANT